MLPKVLNASYGVPKDLSSECASLVNENGRFVEIIREIGGSPHVLLEANVAKLGQKDATTGSVEKDERVDCETPATTLELPPKPEPRPTSTVPPSQHSQPHKPIFVAHGKNKGPLQQLAGSSDVLPNPA